MKSSTLRDWGSENVGTVKRCHAETFPSKPLRHIPSEMELMERTVLLTDKLICHVSNLHVKSTELGRMDSS